MKIAKANATDIPQLVLLLNSAYRGEVSNKGWTTESHLIGGEIRTDGASITEVLNKEGSVILKYQNEDDTITGTVNLQKHGQKLYLGMFAVSPFMQGAGIGKQLLKAAEEHAKDVGCAIIYMLVISVRTELIDWYKRHGYVDKGERKPFIEDGLTGNHLQPLEFAVLEKAV
jgi:ribosomal protein S18 acetylase RimI-like enzyme